MRSGFLASLLLASSLVEHWPVASSHPFRQAARLGPGFSYRYDGPAGLTVTRQERVFPEFEAIEYTVRFRNTGDVTLPPLSAIEALDLQFGAAVLDGISVVSAASGRPDNVFPPEAFALRRRLFGPLTPVNARVLLGPNDLPFWFLDNPQLQAGLLVALGGRGPWEATVAVDYSQGVLTLRGGALSAPVRLAPGEEISGPTVLLGAYRGPLWAGSNRLRRLVRLHHAPAGAPGLDGPIDLGAPDPHVVRFLLQGLNHFLPGNAAYAEFTWPSGRNRVIPDIAFQSFFAGAFSVPPPLREPAKKHLAVYQEIRRYLDEDYYPLAPQPLSLDAWEGWQFHDPQADEGFVQAFRLQSAEGFRQFRLQGLSPAATYRFRDPYTGEQIRLSGAQAREEGLGFQLPTLSSKTLIYQRQDRLNLR